MLFLKRLRQSTQKPQWDVVAWPWGGWNYPEPIMSDSDWVGPRPPDDPYFKNLVYMADYGWHYYQKAFVEMQLIHPLANYKPDIPDEFRQTFDARYQSNGMPLVIYERDGKLISGNDWESYWLYREREDPAIPCIILGHFKEVSGIAICDRPFMNLRPDFAAKPKQPLTTW